MKFEFCGGIDCPEWVLSEVALLNKITAIKLRMILNQIFKKIISLPYEEDKLIKLCKDCKLNPQDTQCLLALIQFILTSAGRFGISEQNFQKELLQMGIAIENVTALVKVYQDNKETLMEALVGSSFKVSRIEDLQYKISYMLASSSSGFAISSEGAAEPLETIVTVNMKVREFPSGVDREHKVKFGTTKEKFLQMSTDLKEALGLMKQFD